MTYVDRRSLLRAVTVSTAAFLAACGQEPTTRNLASASPTAAPTRIVTIPTALPVGSLPLGSVDLIGTIEHDFQSPTGVALDGQGNLYVIDHDHDRIQKFDRDGKFVLMWGSNGTGDGQFDFFYGQYLGGGVGIDERGTIYVHDATTGRIEVFDDGGHFLRSWGSIGSGDGQFSDRSSGIAVKNGVVYATDYRLNRVQKFDANGRFLTKWGLSGSGDGEFTNCGGVAVDERAKVYVVDLGSARIQKFDTNGQFLLSWGSQGTGDGQFLTPAWPASDGQGHIYVTDKNNHRVQVFDDLGRYLGQWGSEGSGPGQFKHPTGIAVGKGGIIYVGDWDNNRVQKFRVR